MLKAQANEPQPFGPDPVEGLLKICDKVKRYPLNKADRGSSASHLAALHARDAGQALEGSTRLSGSAEGHERGGADGGRVLPAIRKPPAGESVADSIERSARSSRATEGLGKSLDDIYYVGTTIPVSCGVRGALRADSRSSTGSRGSDRHARPIFRRRGRGRRGRVERPLHLMTALRAKGRSSTTVVVLDCNQGVGRRSSRRPRRSWRRKGDSSTWRSRG